MEKSFAYLAKLYLPKMISIHFQFILKMLNIESF